MTESDHSATQGNPSPSGASDHLDPGRLALVALDVHKRFGATRALDGVELSVAPGEVHGLVGANGAGKSTLVKILSGALTADKGTIGIGSWRGVALTPRQAQQLGLSTIYQDPSLVPTLRISENIALGREAARAGLFVSRRSEQAQSRRLLDRVGIEADPDTRVERLAPAAQQLLELAKALHRAAKVILMDEPTASLGAADSERLYGTIEGLRASGVSVVYISHRLDEVLRICDRITVLRDGRTVLSAPTSDLDEGQLIRAMIGSALVMEEYVPSNRGPVALSLESISQGTRLTDISLEVHAGEVVGVTGLVGSGRSRLTRVIFGVERPDRGEMRLYEQPYSPASPAEAIAAGVGLIPEDRKRDGLLLYLGVGKNITLARMPTNSVGLVDGKQERSVVQGWIRKLGIMPASARAAVRTLSGGNQQKVLIARWLNARSRVLVFDQPGQGVDVGAKEEILREIRALAREGHAVIVVSDETGELARVADRVVVMYRGRIAGELTREAITEERVVELSLGAGSALASVRTPEGSG